MTSPGRAPELYSFRITRIASETNQRAFRLSGLTVEVAKWLPAIRLETTVGETFGLLLGRPISGESWSLFEGPLRFDRAPRDLAAFHRQHLEPLRGSWLAVLDTRGERRAYLDPLGTLSLIYDPSAGTAAGTAADLLSREEYDARLDARLHRSLGIPGDGWFPAGLTAHRGVERLLVNHYLDLDRFTQHRHTHWGDAPAGNGAVEQHLDTIAGEVRGMAAALAKSPRPVAVGLTGGADSRLMLAALRGNTDDLLFYTVDAPGGGFDRVRACELADRFDLRHEVLPYVRATTAQSAEWDRRVGHAVATANRAMFPSVAPLSQYVCLGGLGGEVGRCFLWRDIESVPDRVDARVIVDRLKLPRHPLIERRMAEWLDDLPERNPCRILDLAYIEQRMGPWAFAQSYANPASLVLHPLGSAAALRAMLSLPAAYREGDGMILGVIERNWPELLELPINRYGDGRDFRRRLAKLAHPARAWRKLLALVRRS